MDEARGLFAVVVSGVGGLAVFFASGYVVFEILALTHPILFFFLGLPIIAGSTALAYNIVRQWLGRYI